MIILGIDPGTAICGWGVIKKKKSSLFFVDSGYILTRANQSLGQRLDIIYSGIRKLIRDFQPEIIVCEELFFFKNLKTAMKVSQARGIILLAAQRMRVPVVEYTPLQVKQALTGFGRADKQQIQQMVKKLLYLKDIPKPDDVADALACAICHAHSGEMLKKYKER